MEQAPLYNLIKEAGFTVLVFEDHPQFFGNWLVTIKRGHRIYEVVSDNREGWLSFWQKENGRGEKMYEVELPKLNQEQELEKVSQWLVSVKNVGK